jgi:dTMP kinase
MTGTRYIVFEGGEACGKSTQSALAADALDAVHTREPGGTTIGSEIRRLLLDPATIGLDSRAEALLMAADRAQHTAEIVAPALAAGRHVVSDRSAYSSLAYQGYGRGLPLDEVRQVSDWALQGRWPDLVVLLDVPLDVAGRRLDRVRDRMELEGSGFHARVADGFRALAAAEPERFVVLDGVAPIAEVTAAVRAALRERLELDV